MFAALWADNDDARKARHPATYLAQARWHFLASHRHNPALAEFFLSRNGVEIEQAQPGEVEVWSVQLHNHEPYAFTRLKRVFLSDDSRHRVVMVDASKLLICADRDTTDYVLPRVEQWYPGKVRGLREFLDPDQARIPEMPYVTIKTRNRRTLLGLVGLDKEGVVSFRNGQHRARYMAFAGATRFPVEVHETEVTLLESYCAAVEGTHNDGAPARQSGNA